MSTHIRAKTDRQLEHSGSRGQSHLRDKAEGERRRRVKSLCYPAAQHPTEDRPFHEYIDGHEQKRDPDTGTWTRCVNPEEYPKYLLAQSRDRSRFKDGTIRKGKPISMLRKAATPIEILVTTFPPWLSNWALAEFKAKRDARPFLAKIRNCWIPRAISRLAGIRYLIGYSFHCDTDDLHFDLAVSRQDGKGGRIGRAGLGLVGPWATATDRQVRACAIISSNKASRLSRDVANFRHRYGDGSVPLDVTLARDLDEAADNVLRAQLKPWKEAYAAKVPELERAHIAAELSAIDTVRAKIAEGVSQSNFEPTGPTPNL
jgi:hypothetical protein